MSADDETLEGRSFPVVSLLLILMMVSIVLMVGPFLLDEIAGVGDHGEITSFSNQSVRVSDNTYSTVDPAGDVISLDRVVDSTGYAIELTGASDSYVQSNEPVTFAEDGTFSACTFAQVDSGAGSDSMTALSLNGRVLIQYNGSEGNWSAWYYDEGDRDSYRVNVSAPNQPGNLTHVCAIANATHFSIYRNNTIGESDPLTSSSIEDADLNTTNWDGVLEETRVDDDPLDSSQRQQLIDSPVAPITSSNRTARLMYDEGAGSSTEIFVAGTSATVNNGQWVSGHPGHTLTDGVDYQTRLGLEQIRTLSGGQVAGAPVIWASYELKAVLIPPEITALVDSAWVLASVLSIILVIGALLFVVLATGRESGGDFM